MAVKEGALISHYDDDDDSSSYEECGTIDDESVEQYDSNDNIHNDCLVLPSTLSDLNADEDEYLSQDYVSWNSWIHQQPIESINNHNIPLSRAALSLLHHVSHQVGTTTLKPQRCIAIASIDGDEIWRRLNSALYRQLVALRQHIPASKHRTGKSSCVITEALEYLESLRKNVRDLEKFIDELPTTKATQRIQPDVNYTADDVEMQLEALADGDIQIQVSCKKRRGLMTDMLMAMESLDLILDSMNVSYTGTRFIFQAVATSNDEICSMMIDEEVVRKAILKVICNYHTSNIHRH